MSTAYSRAKAAASEKHSDPVKERDDAVIAVRYNADRATETSLPTPPLPASLHSTHPKPQADQALSPPAPDNHPFPLGSEKGPARTHLSQVAPNGFPSPRVISSTGDPALHSGPAGNPRGSSELEQEADVEIGERSSSAERREKETDPSDPPDPNTVDWDGPDDPQNARNWSSRKKWGHVAVVASITFLTYTFPSPAGNAFTLIGCNRPLASSMFAPGVPEAMTEFKSTNEQLASFVVSIYVLGYAFGPLVLAPLSEFYGRLPLYQVSNLGFVIFTVACAVSTNLNMLIGFRFLQGLFGSCPLTIGGGTIADIFVQEKRGGVMAIWALGPLMGPVIGPVAGGYLSEAVGWRWVFWVIAIAGAAISLPSLFFLCETYSFVILDRKAKRLRKETGNPDLKSKLASPYTQLGLFKVSIVRPVKMLLLSPIVLGLSTFIAVVYGYLYLLFTTLTVVFEGQYHFSAGSVGLTYLGIGVGSLVGTVIFGVASDKILKYMSAKGEMKPEYRLPPMIPGSLFIPVGLFIYGWTAEKHIHWIVPIIGTSLLGFGLLATFMPITTYLVDAFTVYAASALAANAILRSLVGALLPLAGRKMYATLGLAWGNSLLAFIALAMCPIPYVFFRYGERIRKSKRFHVEF
ncbi:MAG: hypothetical protein Q9163_001578 [Psora crenata]